MIEPFLRHLPGKVVDVTQGKGAQPRWQRIVPVVIRDAETGAYLGSISFFGKNWQTKAITSQDLDGDGVSEISVLAEKDDGTEVVIQLKDSITGDEMKWIELPLN